MTLSRTVSAEGCGPKSDCSGFKVTFEAGCEWQMRNWSASYRPLTDGGGKPRAVARKAGGAKEGCPQNGRGIDLLPGCHEENADEMLMREKAGGRSERKHGAGGLASERTRTAGKLGVGGAAKKSGCVCVEEGGFCVKASAVSQ